MDVVAFVSPPLLSHLRVVTGREHTLLPVEGWAALEGVVRGRIVDVVVADPMATGVLEVAQLERLVRHFPSTPVIVYTGLSPATVKAIVRLARSGVEHVVLNRFDDEPGRFRELLEQVPAHSLGEQMLEALAEPMAALPAMVGRAIEQLFRHPLRFRSAGDLAAAAGMNTRTLYRHLEPAGLPSPRLLVVGARALRAYAYLRDPGRSIKDVATKVGYHSSFQLAQQMRELTGVTPRHARQRLGPEEFISRAARALRAPRSTRERE